ncbi:MAG: Hsp20/alpha crystallin family protein [Kiritimatiellae bacterium]|nr:Hsp20/alpha crystallin family protein [Kiritimatiellia bacterium]
MVAKKHTAVSKRGECALPTRRIKGEHPVLDLQRDINRMFDNFTSGFLPMPVGRWTEGAFLPKVNVSEGDKEVKVTVELPGLAEKDVDVSVSRGRLTLEGEKKTEKEDRGKNFHYLERSSGSFYRDIPLPENADPDKAQAVFKHGVLTVTLPKRPGVKEERKKLAIKREE